MNASTPNASVSRAAFDVHGVILVDADAEPWRSDWWYSRACSIFGGSGEIQRTIIADRVLQLPRETEGR